MKLFVFLKDYSTANRKDVPKYVIADPLASNSPGVPLKTAESWILPARYWTRILGSEPCKPTLRSRSQKDFDAYLNVSVNSSFRN